MRTDEVALTGCSWSRRCIGTTHSSTWLCYLWYVPTVPKTVYGPISILGMIQLDTVRFRRVT